MNKFSLLYGIKQIDKKKEVVVRKASKAIIITDNKILLIRTNKGDYKFPGGGYKKGETYEDCLKRELKEETGYTLLKVNELIGETTERRIDKYDKNKYYSMESQYYSVEIDLSVQEELNLDNYEKELDFLPIFVDIKKAYETNLKVLQKEDHNPWVQRETDVLSYLLN